MGAPKKKIPSNFPKYYEKWKGKDITATEFAMLMGFSRSTLYRYIKEFEV